MFSFKSEDARYSFQEEDAWVWLSMRRWTKKRDIWHINERQITFANWFAGEPGRVQFCSIFTTILTFRRLHKQIDNVVQV